MILRIISFAIIAFNCVSAFGLDVATSELAKSKKIDFINYSGPSTASPDFNEVGKIGTNLADGSLKNGRASFLLKYSVLRVHSEEKDLLSADIFSIDRQAKVNHINTLRKILSSYYLRRFNYSQTESNILAVVTTYYNAIYRGDVNYFSTQYQKAVVSKINASNAGLSIRYYEWPGKTKILIPLSETDGNHPDIFKLADPKTTEEIRKKADKGIPERKEIVKLKEKAIIKEKDTIAKKEDANKQSKEVLIKKENLIEQKKTDIEKDKGKVTEDKKKIDEIKNPAEKERAKEDIVKKENEIQQKEKEVKKDEESLNKEKEKTASNERDVEKKKEDVAKKEDSLKQEKDIITSDEKNIPGKEAQQKETPASQADLTKQKDELDKKSKEIALREEDVKAKLDKVYKEKLYYLKVNNWFNDGIYNNEMFVINPLTRKVILKSPYTTIAGRKFDIFAKGVVVIGFEGKLGANFEHRLVLLDSEKLTVLASGKDIIFWRSFVEVREGQIYCILSLNGKYFLARFSDSLDRIAQSKSEVDKDSTISFYGDYIYVNSPDKKIMVLNKNDLSFLERIDPDKDFDQ